MSLAAKGIRAALLTGVRLGGHLPFSGEKPTGTIQGFGWGGAADLRGLSWAWGSRTPVFLNLTASVSQL